MFIPVIFHGLVYFGHTVLHAMHFFLFTFYDFLGRFLLGAGWFPPFFWAFSFRYYRYMLKTITTFGITFFALLPVVVGRNSWMRIVLKNCWFEGASDAAPQRNLDLLLGIKNLVWNYPIKNIFSIKSSFINIFSLECIQRQLQLLHNTQTSTEQGNINSNLWSCFFFKWGKQKVKSGEIL